MKEGMGRGKEHEVPTHLIKIQNLPMLHASLKYQADAASGTVEPQPQVSAYLRV